VRQHDRQGETVRNDGDARLRQIRTKDILQGSQEALEHLEGRLAARRGHQERILSVLFELNRVA
jgi:hypothetical protein